MKELPNLEGLPVIGSVEQRLDGAYTLHLRTAVPCQNHRDEFHVIQVGHRIAAGTPMTDVLELTHLYEIAGGYSALFDGVTALVNGPKKGLRSRLRDLLALHAETAARAKIEAEEAQDDEAAGIAALLDRLFKGEDVSADPIEEDIKSSSAVLQEMFGGPLGSVLGARFADWRREMTGEDGEMDPDKVLASMPEGPARESMRAQIDAGVRAGFIRPYADYKGQSAGQSGSDQSGSDAVAPRAVAPAKPGDETERTVVVGVTRKQAADYRERGVFGEVSRVVFGDKTVTMEMRLPVAVAEKMFADTVVQSKIGTGPRRRMYMMAGVRLRIALNKL